MKKALVVGGSNGIGLSIVSNLRDYDHIYIVDKTEPDIKLSENMSFEQFDLRSDDFSMFDKYDDIDSLIITAGFGNIGLFEDIEEGMISDLFLVNTISVIRIIKHFYHKLNSKDDFFCVVLSSISGLLSSPYFSVYGATKAALCKFIESVNVELEKSNSINKILNVCPGSIKGTRFYNDKNDIEVTTPLAKEIIDNMLKKNDLFIPQYVEVFRNVLDRYHKDFRTFGRQSYDYKKESKR